MLYILGMYNIHRKKWILASGFLILLIGATFVVIGFSGAGTLPLFGVGCALLMFGSLDVAYGLITKDA